MIKRTGIVVLLLLFCALLGYGCHTAGRSFQGAVQGASEDFSGIGGGITKLDNWIKKNMW
ncbi:MAG: hypothetical protein PHT41_08005 [Candidatus Omnitrophica bacterium]|nr:hypothetical protein [Candidatus Omnitrophota bacterium]